MNNQEIAEFYDEFSERQLKIGANERLISLYNRLLKLGLKNDSRILELGCGVGIFTKLLSKKIKNGAIEAVDLSEKSTEIAAKNLQKKAVNFVAADIVHYIPETKSLDFITLLDVIEHIPLELHSALFSNLAKICDQKTQLVINFPNPRYLEFVQKNNPKDLQIIDQSIELRDLVAILDNAGLEIIFYEKYNIWEVEDYDFLAVRKKRNFELKHLADQRSLLEKIVHKIELKINQIKYNT